MKSKKTYLLDAGHGGMVNGAYVTAPKKMYTFEDGYVIYEGVFNRLVTNEVAAILGMEGIDYRLVVTEQDDISLPERVIRANRWHDTLKNCVYISLHANAGGGHGFEIYTSIGQTDSDRLANEMFIAYKDSFPDMTARADLQDGDYDKEANFYVLRQTKCPAMLIESGFMDDRGDAEWMMSKEGVKEIAAAIVKGIKRIENYTYSY